MIQMKNEKKLYIIKLGGSAITEKKTGKFIVKKEKIRKIAKEIKKAQKKKDFQLIIVHGAGTFGHKIVSEYGIANGVKTKKQIEGFKKTKKSMRRLCKQIAKILKQNGIKAVPAQDKANIIQHNKKMVKLNLEGIKTILQSGKVPILHGDMVKDTAIGASVISGDTIIAMLANKLNATKVFYGTDVNGIYDSDPRKNKKAKLIKEINNSNIKKVLKMTTGANAIDVTGGMKGKLEEIRKNIKGIECFVFNLQNEKNINKLLLEKKTKCTKIIFN